MKKFVSSAAGGAAVLLAVLCGTAPVAVADEPDAVDVVAAAAPGDIASAADVALLDGGPASVLIDGLSIEVPDDARDGLAISAGAGEVTIGLPFAAAAGEGEATAPGTATYDNGNDTSSVVVVHETGALQVATVIDDASAPTRYDYPIDVPAGASLQASDAGAVVVDAAGEVLGTFAAPWAKDADGRDVPTRYEVHGATLTQVVEHDADFAYPIVADPVYTTSTIYISKATVKQMYQGMNGIGNVCTVLPVPYWVGIACSGFPGRQAVEQAYWQNKRIKVSYVSCGFNYCSHNTFSVVN